MPVEAMVTGLGLGMDAMSVAAVIGMKWNGPHQKFRLAWHMGLSQFLMPCIGYAMGQPLASHLSIYGKYAAAALVAALGAKMLLECARSRVQDTAEEALSSEPRPAEPIGPDPTRGFSLIAISVATSIDAMVIGFSLSLRGRNAFSWDHLIYDATIIGLIAALMALIGANVGQSMGTRFGRTAETVGACVLILLAISFLAL